MYRFDNILNFRLGCITWEKHKRKLAYWVIDGKI